MKYLSLILLAITFNAGAVEKDKKYHFVASSLISSAIGSYTQDSQKAFYACMAVGLTKEIYDELKGSHLSGRDLIADAAGCLLGSGVRVTKDSIKYEYTWRF
ncbi:MAG TPA: hypothetical protein EYN54_09410 [Methylococcaceae bacterium]|nr:hypothetical protein [Methylococcaceae bacterium]